MLMAKTKKGNYVSPTLGRGKRLTYSPRAEVEMGAAEAARSRGSFERQIHDYNEAQAEVSRQHERLMNRRRKIAADTATRRRKIT